MFFFGEGGRGGVGDGGGEGLMVSEIMGKRVSASVDFGCYPIGKNLKRNKRVSIIIGESLFWKARMTTSESPSRIKLSKPRFTF